MLELGVWLILKAAGHLCAKEESKDEGQVERGRDDALNGALGSLLFEVGAQSEPALDVSHLVQPEVGNTKLSSPVTRGQGEKLLRVPEALEKHKKHRFHR